jgi:multimeric flavodoxin WrbA
MKILGISGSPRQGSTTDRLVQEVLLGAADCETEFISLAGKKIGPCVDCLGCVKTNVCVLKDDLAGLRPKIVEADAYVIGGPCYFRNLNGLTHCFFERWFQFRHREEKAVAGKPGVIVAAGGAEASAAAQVLRTFFEYNQLDCVGEVTAQGAVPCFVCGYGENCRVGGIYKHFGPGTRITEEITPSLAKQPEALASARRLGKALSDRLNQRRA